MLNFFHHLFNPHCPDCKEESQESKICNSCEILRTELATVRFENQQLLDKIFELVSPKPIEQTHEMVNPQPINSSMSFRVRRQMLEAEDRAKAEVIRKSKLEAVEANKTTEQLEEELLNGEVNNG